MVQLVRPAANTEGGVQAGLACSVGVGGALSQVVVHLRLSIKPVSRDQSARSFLLTESRCVVCGAGAIGGRGGCRRGGGAPAIWPWVNPNPNQCGLGRGTPSERSTPLDLDLALTHRLSAGSAPPPLEPTDAPMQCVCFAPDLKLSRAAAHFWTSNTRQKACTVNH